MSYSQHVRDLQAISMLVFFPPAVFHTEKVKSYSSLFEERGLGFKHLSIQSERFSVLWR